MSTEQYDALRHGAGLVTQTMRGRIAITGSDRSEFLQGLLTNDIASIDVGEGCYSAYLTSQGRMIADLEVFKLADAVLLDVHATVKDRIINIFEGLVFTEDVQISDLTSSWAAYGVHGPLAATVVAASLDRLGDTVGSFSSLQKLKDHDCREFFLSGLSVVIARTDELGEHGLSVFVDQGEATSVHKAIVVAGGVEVDPEIADVVRVESGRPTFPADMNGQTIPLEAGIEDRAISFTKGCYVGQEVIIRILHRGQGRVARKLVGLTLNTLSDSKEDDIIVPQPGAALLRDDETVGQVTSAVVSPGVGKVIALAYLRRDLSEPGTKVTVHLDHNQMDGVVTAVPFVTAYS